MSNTWQPPTPPPRLGWWGRRSRSAKIGIAAVAGLVAIGAIGAVTSDDDPEVTADPDEPAAEATTGAATAPTTTTTTSTSTTAPPTTTTSTSTTAPPTTTTTAPPTTTIDPDVIVVGWLMGTSIPLLDELADLTFEFSDATDQFDIVGAVGTLYEMIDLIDSADPPPAEAPASIRNGWDEFTTACPTAWSTMADAMGDLDVDAMDLGLAQMDVCMDAIKALTEAFQDETAARR
jgi:hypothetical protein